MLKSGRMRCLNCIDITYCLVDVNCMFNSLFFNQKVISLLIDSCVQEASNNSTPQTGHLFFMAKSGFWCSEAILGTSISASQPTSKSQSRPKPRTSVALGWRSTISKRQWWSTSAYLHGEHTAWRKVLSCLLLPIVPVPLWSSNDLICVLFWCLILLHFLVQMGMY